MPPRRNSAVARCRGSSENRYRRDAARRDALGTRARDRGVARRRFAQARRRVHAVRERRRSREPRHRLATARLQGRARDARRCRPAIPRSVHVANSAALVLRPDSHFNLVRPGLAIYGLPPVSAVRERVELTPVMTFKTRVMQIKRVPAGHRRQLWPYLRHPRAKRDRRARGRLRRRLSARPPAWRRGADPRAARAGGRRGLHGSDDGRSDRRARRRGRRRSDLVGRRGDGTISVNDVARLAQTISYEMLCTVGRRVPRVYR